MATLTHVSCYGRRRYHRRYHRRPARKPYINLWDESYHRDFTAITEDCPCLACRKHTKGYIHHLLKTHEILGSILLMR